MVSMNYIQVLLTILCIHQGRPQDLGGGARIFFQLWEFACREARGVLGHAPPRIFFKTMQFGAFQGEF